MEERPLKKTKKIDQSSPLDSEKENKNTDLIPTDIVESILQRLPAKSIAKFVTVSKSWAKIIRSNYFINSFSEFQTQQQQHSHHRLLLINHNLYGDWSFFSSSDEKPPLKKKFISRFAFKFHWIGCYYLPIYVKGLVNFMFGSIGKHQTQIISNPSTGKSIVLPVIKGGIQNRLFGFDPINCEYKVLCLSGTLYSRIYRYKVLTIGSNSFWREIDHSWITRFPCSEGVCIDGIIYYLVSGSSSKHKLYLARFDVSSEKFLKELPCLFLKPKSTGCYLINYRSKLAIGKKPNEENSIDLWVLEDAEKVEWLKIDHDVSPWRSLMSGYVIKILGTTRSGEIVYSCDHRNGYFFVIYQNEEKDEYRRVDIISEIDREYRCFTCRIVFIDYVESVMLL